MCKLHRDRAFANRRCYPLHRAVPYIACYKNPRYAGLEQERLAGSCQPSSILPSCRRSGPASTKPFSSRTMLSGSHSTPGSAPIKTNNDEACTQYSPFGPRRRKASNSLRLPRPLLVSLFPPQYWMCARSHRLSISTWWQITLCPRTNMVTFQANLAKCKARLSSRIRSPHHKNLFILARLLPQPARLHSRFPGP